MEKNELFTEVPVLPVVVPLAAVAQGLLLWHLRRRDQLSMPRAAVASALCVYVAGIAANTVFPIFLDKPRSDASWHAQLNLRPIVGYERADAAMNVAVFIPLGILLALAIPRCTWWRVLSTATLFSLGIEVSQYVTARLLGGGHIADVNDLLFNVVGAALGIGLVLGLFRLPVGQTLVDRFRWV